MKLKDFQIDKTNEPLRHTLIRARGPEKLRVILELASKQGQSDEESKVLEPSQFSSYQEYRKAKIEQMEQAVAHDIKDTLQALRSLDLYPFGGKYSHKVLVEGTAHQILASLNLSGVKEASMDEEFEMDKPRRKIGDIIRSAIQSRHDVE